MSGLRDDLMCVSNIPSQHILGEEAIGYGRFPCLLNIVFTEKSHDSVGAVPPHYLFSHCKQEYLCNGRLPV